MNITAKQYAKTLFEVLQETADKDHELVLENFSKTLAQNNDSHLFEQIVLEYGRYEIESKGLKIPFAPSAQPLDSNTEKDIIKHLNGLVSKNAVLKKQVDDNILGGVVIRLNDKE